MNCWQHEGASLQGEGKMSSNCRLCTKFLFAIFVLGVMLFYSELNIPAISGSRATRNQFYFVQITDTHFGDEDNYERTRQVIQAINNLPLKIEFVVHTGDITMEMLEHTPTVNSVVELFKLLKPPVHYIPGNHDILRQKHDATMQAYRSHFGELITQYEYSGVVCIFIYTEPLAKDFYVPSYDALEELDKRLKLSAGKPVIVFHHSPSVEDFFNNQMHPGWRAEIRDRWIALLNKYDVKGVIAGHFHRDELHWLGNVPLYVSASVAGYWGRQATFRIYEYKDGKIGYRTQYLP
jgi:3',5'-cyclic AMP phosphodiesterase CpdA